MRDLQSLCDRLAEMFNTDDTPDELCTEAREAIEELWRERDQLHHALKVAVEELTMYVDFQQKHDYIEYAADTQAKLTAISTLLPLG